jgi:hypothetical protein
MQTLTPCGAGVLPADGAVPCLESVALKGLPSQNNTCDCALFVLLYVQFFCHAHPSQLAVGVLRGLDNAKGE